MNMKKYIYLIQIIFLTLLFHPLRLQAADKPTRDIIFSAMKDELNRSVNKLKLENLAAPFFIQYNVRDGKLLEIKASLGAILNSEERIVRNHSVRVLVGSYQNNDENFFDISSLYNQSNQYTNISMPIDNSYDGIRRALWISTDNTYKKAAEQFERKKAALSRQAVSAEMASLEDFSKASASKIIKPAKPFKFEKTLWEETAKEISAVFKDYPEIFNSELRIFFYNADEFIINSEGTEIITPLNLASIQINVSTQAEDGEELKDHILRYAVDPEELPSKSEILKDIQELCEKMTALRKAPVFKDSYTGPVLFEGEAVPEFFAQRLFRSSNGIIAVRKPLVSDPNGLNYVNRIYGETMENRIERRIASKDLTIKTAPFLENFAGLSLIGSYGTDEEGVSPAEELVLVQNGILKNMLSNRTPTLASRRSNAHQRPIIEEWRNRSTIAPGIINIQTDNGKSEEKIKQELIQMAKEEGLDYAIIVRKLKSIVTGKYPSNDMMMYSGSQGQAKMLEKPIYIYRIYVKDGREELVRSAEIDNPSVSALKHLSGVSKKQIAYNLLMPNAVNSSPYDISGAPASFITPQSLLFEELEVKYEKRDFTPKVPCVSSPLRKQ